MMDKIPLNPIISSSILIAELARIIVHMHICTSTQNFHIFDFNFIHSSVEFFYLLRYMHPCWLNLPFADMDRMTVMLPERKERLLLIHDKSVGIEGTAREGDNMPQGSYHHLKVD